MDQQIYTITFDDVSDAEAERYASELRHILLDASPDVKIERRRDDPYAQDFGATLVLLLGTSSVTAIATAIGDWLKLRQSAGITIKNDKGEVIATNLTGKEVLKLVELFHADK